MRNTETIDYHGHIYEYEIDELKFVFIKDGTSMVCVGQIRALRQTDNIENVATEMIKSYLQIKPIK